MGLYFKNMEMVNSCRECPTMCDALIEYCNNGERIPYDRRLDECPIVEITIPPDDSDECKEQKSTLDLISRQDIIGYIDRVRNCGLGKKKSLEYISKYVERIPSAEAVEGWIPCSERLPKKGEVVLITKLSKMIYDNRFNAERGDKE